MTMPFEQTHATGEAEDSSFGHDDPVLLEPGSTIAPLAFPEGLLEWW